MHWRRSLDLPAAYRPSILVGCALALVLGFFSARQAPLLVLLAAVGIAATLVVLARPFLGVVFIALALPFERLGAYESALGTIRASHVLVVLTVIAWIALVIRQRRRFALERFPILVPILFFLAAAVLGTTKSPNVSYSLLVLGLTCLTIACSVVVASLTTSEERLRSAVIALLVSAALVSVFGLFQFVGDLAGLPTTVTGLRELYTRDVFGFPRVQSTALEPLYFANYLLLPLGILFAAFVRRRTMLPRLLSFALLALLGVNLVFTVSRGGYFGAAVTIVVITFLALRDVFRPQVVIPLVLGALLVLWATLRGLSIGDVARINVETFTTHVQSIFFGASYAERLETIDAATQAFWRSPWVGLGPGSFGPFIAAHPLMKPESGWRIVNNEPLELLTETGILGIFSILTALGILLARSARILRKMRHDGIAGVVHLGTLGALFGVVAQYQTFSTLYIMHVWFLVGMLLAAQNILLQRFHEH